MCRMTIRINSFYIPNTLIPRDTRNQPTVLTQAEDDDDDGCTMMRWWTHRTNPGEQNGDYCKATSMRFWFRLPTILSAIWEIAIVPPLFRHLSPYKQPAEAAVCWVGTVEPCFAYTNVLAECALLHIITCHHWESFLLLFFVVSFPKVSLLPRATILGALSEVASTHSAVV